MVELRFFGGLSVEETAEVLQVSPITVMREWKTRQSLALSRADRRDREWTLNAGTTSIGCCSRRWTVRRRSATCFCGSACGGDEQLEGEASLAARRARPRGRLSRRPAIDLAARARR